MLGDHLLPGGPDLLADIEVVAVELAEGLVEADVLDDPPGDGHHEAIDHVDLARPRLGSLLDVVVEPRISPPPYSS